MFSFDGFWACTDHIKVLSDLNYLNIIFNLFVNNLLFQKIVHLKSQLITNSLSLNNFAHLILYIKLKFYIILRAILIII